MQTDARQVLYQKKGVTISKVASSLLSRNCGDRIPPISYYEKEYGAVSYTHLCHCFSLSWHRLYWFIIF